jgi:signal transduction histidine kinase
MRRRLTGTYLILVALALAGLAIPLGLALAATRTEQMTRDRYTDATQFASLAIATLRSGESATLTEALFRYRDLYGISTIIADREGKAVATAGDLPQAVPQEVAAATQRALAGVVTSGDRIAWPWKSVPLVIAVPVSDGGETVGAVVTVSPTTKTRKEILTVWAVIAAGVAAAGISFSLLAATLSRWVLRPVAELDLAAHRVGSWQTPHEPLSAAWGPPELRRLTRTFNEMARSVTDAMQRQRDFVAQASHQLRNPLTALMLRVESLQEFLADAAGRTELELAIEETGRLGRILDGLLALARAEQGRHEIVVVDAAMAASDRVTAWLPVAAQRGIALTRQGSERAGALAVPTAIDQALDALIDNALKFCEPGCEVRVEVHAQDDVVDIHVIDNGPGLADDARVHATQRFWRASTAGSVEGSGLGLPIAAVLAEASGGTLDLRAAKPQGLDARLRFPGALLSSAATAHGFESWK